MLSNCFEIKKNQLVILKTGEIIPEYEPVFILRGCDVTALAPIVAYQGLMRAGSKEWWMLEGIAEAFREFRKQYPDEMKTPEFAYGEN